MCDPISASALFFGTAATAATATTAAVAATSGLIGAAGALTLTGVISAVGTIATIGSVVASVAGQRQQQQSRAAQLNYQSQVARNNQVIAEEQAQDIEARGKVAETLQRRQTAQIIGRQKTALAANGVVINEGSALEITSDTESQGDFDALVVRQNFQRDARSARIQGDNFGSQAGFASLGAKNITAGIPLGTASTLLAGAGNVASKWSSFNKVGL